MATITSPREPSPNPNRITSPKTQSRTGTPVPSVRTSFDAVSATGSTSNVSTPTTATGTPLNQRRNRAALRDYYNLKSKPQATGSGAISPGGRRGSTDSESTAASSNATLTGQNNNNGQNRKPGSILPPQIDDPTFNAETYVQELLKTSTLQDILRAEGTLVSEIRSLDGERKALVYDNYSKLIKAVGTIGEMQKGMTREKSRYPYQSGNIMGRNVGIGNSGDGDATAAIGIDGVRSLEAKLDNLMTVVKEIKNEQQSGRGTKQNVLARKNARDQRKGQELVRWVVDAPDRLKKLVDEDEKSEAERQWSDVRALLDAWNGTKGVEEVRLACQKVMGSGDDDNEDEDSDEGSGEGDG